MIQRRLKLVNKFKTSLNYFEQGIIVEFDLFLNLYE